jgi:hypothetical protein
VSASDTLIAIGQIAVTLAGFAGIVVVLGRRGHGEWTNQEIFDLGALLRPSLSAALLCMIPLILDSAELAESLVWAIASALAFTYLTVMMVGFVIPQGRASGFLIGSRRHAALISLVVQVAPLVANAVWLRAAWPYLGVQLVLLSISVAAFVRLLTSTR